MSQVQAEYTAKDFALWKAYEKTSPGMPERMDLLAGQVCMYIYNMARGKGSRPMDLVECTLDFNPVRAVTNVNTLKQKLYAATAFLKKKKG